MSTNYLNSIISLTTSNNIRYEGTLSAINPSDSTVELTNVHSYGTEDRAVSKFIPASPSLIQNIVFHRSEIAGIVVVSSPSPSPPSTEQQHFHHHDNTNQNPSSRSQQPPPSSAAPNNNSSSNNNSIGGPSGGFYSGSGNAQGYGQWNMNNQIYGYYMYLQQQIQLIQSNPSAYDPQYVNMLMSQAMYCAQMLQQGYPPQHGGHPGAPHFPQQSGYGYSSDSHQHTQPIAPPSHHQQQPPVQQDKSTHPVPSQPSSAIPSASVPLSNTSNPVVSSPSTAKQPAISKPTPNVNAPSVSAAVSKPAQEAKPEPIAPSTSHLQQKNPAKANDTKSNVQQQQPQAPPKKSTWSQVAAGISAPTTIPTPVTSNQSKYHNNSNQSNSKDGHQRYSKGTRGASSTASRTGDSSASYSSVASSVSNSTTNAAVSTQSSDQKSHHHHGTQHGGQYHHRGGAGTGHRGGRHDHHHHHHHQQNDDGMHGKFAADPSSLNPVLGADQEFDFAVAAEMIDKQSIIAELFGDIPVRNTSSGQFHDNFSIEPAGSEERGDKSNRDTFADLATTGSHRGGHNTRGGSRTNNPRGGSSHHYHHSNSHQQGTYSNNRSGGQSSSNRQQQNSSYSAPSNNTHNANATSSRGGPQQSRGRGKQQFRVRHNPSGSSATAAAQQ